ncbi:alcohol dehydrogenase catalytic domain-containing protein [Aliiruegeria sabulilitoris]|uniref:alcohol dehydrogenase catalytic domain-containing protein n=1 Tax=Aliiruegeria sabulilitoris TaxID=1510458 RepID=UPI000835AF35|nr:zinc-binding dehydrogenase [Aliiruegeria sabulilitoris]NDR59453.1 zinc-binding dehydrogenase [Pseudoruegeria sp. M32A2M]
MDIPTKMKGLALLEDGYANAPATQELTDLAPYVELRELDVPQPGPGLALIKVARAAVNPSDIAFIKGVYGQARVKDQAAGFEGTGTVVAGDTPLVGQRVSFFAAGSGSWAEYCLAPIPMLIPLRPDLRDEDAAGLIVNPLSAMAMFDIVRDDGADSFVVTAASSQLGKFLIGLGKDHGIGALAVIRRAAPAATLQELGAADVLVTEGDGLSDRISALFEAHSPRILLDAVGDQISADLFFAMPEKARWISYGRLAPTPPTLTQLPQFIFKQKRIEGFWLASWLRETAPEKIGAVVGEVQARFAEGTWHTDITASVPLDNALTELPAAYSQKDSKVLLEP